MKFIASIVLALALGAASQMFGCDLNTSFIVMAIVVAGGIAGSDE